MSRRRLLSNNAEPVEIPVLESLAGDVVFYNKELDEIFIRRDGWQKNEEPIGIVVIPGSHNVYGNGACGVMALLSASTSSPDTGSTSNEGIYWGLYNTDVSELYDYKGTTSYGNNDTWTTVQYYTDYACLPSDQTYFGEKLMNKLSGSDQNCWYRFNNNDHHIPSPYLNDGSRNSDYYNTSLNVANVLSDFKGKENTAILISKATAQSDWKTASSITNMSVSGYSPAVCACWRYSTVGTDQGNWYLPAAGELGYVCVRYQKINDTISALQSYFGKTFCLLTTYSFWSSSEHSSNYAWNINFGVGVVSYVHNKNTNDYVRPFLQLKPKYKFVDMGLSVKWCNMNIGATKPEEYGLYFQWGGTIPYNSDRTPIGGGDAIEFDYNEHCPYWVSGSYSSSKWSKYTASNSYSSTGTADNKRILDLEDDAAHVYIGGDCRMPTEAEYNELINACNIALVTNYNGTGINGRLFTLKADPSKTLFFPASGYLSGMSRNKAGSFGYYWSSSLSTLSYYGSLFNFYSGKDGSMTGLNRHVGSSVRPVLPPENKDWTLGKTFPAKLY